MPRKPYLNNKSEKYVLIIPTGDGYMCYDYFTASSAVNAYRKYQESYEHGDAVRLTKVVIDYGEEI